MKTKQNTERNPVEAIREAIYACRRNEEHSHLSEVNSLEREHKIVLYHVHFFMPGPGTTQASAVNLLSNSTSALAQAQPLDLLV